MELNVNQPQVGMSMKNPSLIKEGEFPLSVNANLQSVNGNFALISNDHSNILGSKFKEGYKVIGTNLVPSLFLTFFFLTNPETKESEIGFIYDASNEDKADPSSECGSCDYEVVEDTPLEQKQQLPLSIYNTFVNAKCLDFDIDHPVTSWVNVENCEITIYFNDFKNPPRYIYYDDFQKVNQQNCPLIETNELDCDKIQIFPETCYPTIEVVDVVSGGQNTAGVYQFAVCYADAVSNKITDYFYVSNPTPLYDRAIIPNLNTSYPIAKSFKLRVSNINTDFEYINIAVIKTINNIPSVSLIETFDVKGPIFEYVYSGIDKNLQADLSVDEIVVKRPKYDKAKITTESNGYLFLADLEEERVVNLQPAISQIPVYWQTVEMDEGSYANPIIAQNYVGYLGDEVYAFGISFTKTNGNQTAIFPFVGREATASDLQELDPETNPDVITNSSCDTEIRNLKWQVYNTASPSGSVVCITEGEEGQVPQTITDEVECFSEPILYYAGVNPSVPNFYYYPPTGIVYPPTNSQEAQALQDWLALPGNVITSLNDPTVRNIIGLCECDSFLSQYPPGATASSVALDVDPNSSNTSLTILNEQNDFELNTYNASSIQTDGILNKIPKPTDYPSYLSPNPCKGDDDGQGIQAWVDQKQNGTPAGAQFVSQTAGDSCSQIETWGSFADLGLPPTKSWYQFTCTSLDGVASIILSTANTSFTVNVYGTDSNGNPFPTPIATATPNSIYGYGCYLFLPNLENGKNYFIEIVGNNPFVGNSSFCKTISFRLCVVTPRPTTTNIIPVPGVTTITQTCEITYTGFPQNSCKPLPKEYGNFAYWESEETYPCNEEVWGNLAGQPIRHFKFPDNTKVKFFEQKGSLINSLSRKLNKIYPKGVRVRIEDIKAALDNAVSLNLISGDERDQFCGYRIYRSNRRGNQSIIAKGLLYDVWEYRDNIYNSGNKVMFPNFPFNDNSDNIYILNRKINNVNYLNQNDYLKHPFRDSEYKNNKYTFDAPNLSFNNPGLGIEIKLEAEQSGIANGNFVDVKNNTKYQYIGAGIISAAVGFSSIEAAYKSVNTVANAAMVLNFEVKVGGTGGTFPIPFGLIFASASMSVLSPALIYSGYAEWYEIIKSFAPFRNYAVYYTGVGEYNINNLGNVGQGNTRRVIANTQYIKPGILNVKTTKGNIRFNNFKRESSVFIELGQNSFFSHTEKEDTSRRNYFNCDQSTGIQSNICSYYGSMKNLLVSQYGQIDNIEWIDTGYNGRIEWGNQEQTTDCETIFGGDTYINRFTKKRKVPMFMEDRVVPSDATQVSPVNQDIQLSLLPNIGYPKFFMNYPTSLDFNDSTVFGLFGDVAVKSKSRVDYNFLCEGSSGQSWKDAGLAAAIVGGIAAGLYTIIGVGISVGAISGAVKSKLGNDLFLKGKYVHSFYGITSFLCESDYNLDYRYGENIKEKDFYPNVADTVEWTQEFNIPMYEDNYYFYNNDYSLQNKYNLNFVLPNDYESDYEACKAKNPNRLIYSLQYENKIFLANNYYDFSKAGGKLLIVKGIENGKVLVIQENRASVFNSFISLETNVANATVGSNTLFNQQAPTLFIQTDLGFGGSQTPAIVSTEFGHFWVDNKRGQVLLKSESVQNIVKPEEEWWFKENLPFKILKDFPDFDITNNFKYVGMAITYDARYKRILFTKRDFELKSEYRGLVTYNGFYFTYKNETFLVTDTKYFCNKSWTISYNPLFKSFISFHSFYPNYYVSNQAYFSSGINYSFEDQSEEGLWYHNLTNKSYQVYYGKLKPFIFEFVIPSKYNNKILENVNYVSEFYRFQDNLSSYLVQDKTYNKAIVYNQNQTSGLLELIPKQKNNRLQFIQYPKQKFDSREILVENIENIWRFNNFYNVAQTNGQPMMTFDCNNIAYRNINPLSIKYNAQYLKDLIRSDYHVIRLINDKYSNYNILQRFSLTSTNTSPS